MIDIDLAQATFEYVLRKKIKEGELPTDKSSIMCEDRYYLVDWKGVTFQQLWSKLIDEQFISSLEEDNLEQIFNATIDTFIKNLSIVDPLDYDVIKKLSDLNYWLPVKNIPKKYYRR